MLDEGVAVSFGMTVIGDPRRERVRKSAGRGSTLGRGIEELDQAMIDDGERFVGIAHAQAVAHAVQRRFEPPAVNIRVTPVAQRRFEIAVQEFRRSI